MVIWRSQRRLFGVLLLPVASGAGWGGCLVLALGHDGTWCPGQDKPKAPLDMAAPALGFYLLFCHRLVSFRWWQPCEVFQEPQRLFPLKLGRAGDSRWERIEAFFFPCLKLLFTCCVVVVLLFCGLVVFSPLSFFLPLGEHTAQYFRRLFFAFKKFLWNYQRIRRSERCFCIFES